MTLTNKRLKHLAKRGKASLAEQRELAARVLKAEKPKPRGQLKVLWDLDVEARRNYVRAETVVRMNAIPFEVEIIRPQGSGLRVTQNIDDYLASMGRTHEGFFADILNRMASELGCDLFADSRVRRTGLLESLRL